MILMENFYKHGKFDIIRIYTICVYMVTLFTIIYYIDKPLHIEYIVV